MRKYIIIIAAVFLAACQDEDFETPSYSQKIVVDGYIEQGQAAKVFLTWSCPYFSEVDSVSILKLVLTTAKVTVADGSYEEILILRKNSEYFPPYYYESRTLKGTVGHTYSLKVEYGGHTVSATTLIPEPPQLDSIWFKLAEDVDTAGYVMIQLTDKAGVDNYYRTLAKKASEEKYSPVFLPNLDGSLIDGQSVNIALTEEGDDASVVLFNKNDTVSVKVYTMNLPAYKFWNSVYSELLNTSNPFAATNSHVQSNISGGLGVWAGYGVSEKQIVCK